ncbi:MAG: glycosyltransferase family 4 protein [Gemmatimonadaceae bacterium]
MTLIRFFCAVEPGIPMFRDLLPYLAARGMDVELVITGQEYRGGREPLIPLLAKAGVAVHTVRVPFARGAAGPRTANVSVAFLFGATVRALFGRRARVNVFLTQPPFFYVWGAVLARLRRQKSVVIVMDVYPDVAIRSGMLRAGGLPARLLHAVSRFGLRQADEVVAIGRCMRELLAREGILPHKLSVIPNWADDRTVFPVPHSENALRRELGFGPNDFLVVYSGNMGQVHVFDDILEVARRLRAQPSIRFVFIGSGSRRREVEAFRDRPGLTNVVLLPMQPATRMSESLSMGDVQFVSLRNGFEGLVVPSKTYGPLAAGRPVIYEGAATGEVARLLTESGAGTVVPVGDPDALEAAVLFYFRSPAHTARASAAALAFARSELSAAGRLAAYQALLCR